LNVFTTFFIAFLLLRDNDVAREMYAQSDTGKNASPDQIKSMAGSFDVMITLTITVVFYGLVLLYVRKMKDYINGKISAVELYKLKHPDSTEITRFCTKCGKENTEGRSFCENCGAGMVHGAKVKKKASSLRTAINIILTILIVFMIGGYKAQQDRKAATNVFNDVLKDTQTTSAENKKYVDLVKKILDYNKTENIKLFPSCLKVENSQVPEFSSFKTEESLKKNLTDLEKCVKEHDGFDKVYDDLIKRMMNEGEDWMAEGNFTEEEKEEFRRSFAKNLYDSKKRELVLKQGVAEQNYYANIQKLYEFLLANFSSYQIDVNEFGEEDIFFSNDKVAEEYDLVAEEFGVALDDYLKAYEELETYINSGLEKLGLDLKLSDVEEYMQK